MPRAAVGGFACREFVSPGLPRMWGAGGEFTLCFSLCLTNCFLIQYSPGSSGSSKSCSVMIMVVLCVCKCVCVCVCVCVTDEETVLQRNQ